MARLKAANNAITKLTVGITAADTSFTVEDAALFPDAPFRVTIDAEIMQVEAIDKLTNTFSAVQRGIEGTVAAPHNNGAEVANRWTAGYLETLATLEESQAMATMAESEAKTHAEAYADDVAATAETSAKTHATGLVGTLSSLLTTAKDNIVAAINEIFAGLGALETDVAAHKAEEAQAHGGVDAASILSKLKTVDGAGSGLDADLLRGLSPDLFLRAPIIGSWKPTSDINIAAAGVYTKDIALGAAKSLILSVCRWNVAARRISDDTSPTNGSVAAVVLSTPSFFAGIGGWPDLASSYGAAQIAINTGFRAYMNSAWSISMTLKVEMVNDTTLRITFTNTASNCNAIVYANSPGIVYAAI